MEQDGSSGALASLLSQPVVKRSTRGVKSFSRSASASSKIKDRHRSTALGGMYHVPHKKTYGGKSTIVGRLFRTASEAGQPWMTKGIKPRSIAEYLVSSSGGNVGEILAESF